MNFPLPSFLAILASGLASALIISAMLRYSHALPMDEPNHRSLHAAPVPRSGGIGIMAGASLGWAILAHDAGGIALLVLPALGLCAFSLLDDVRGLSVIWRLVVQLLAAAFAVLNLGGPAGIPGALLAVLAITWMTNLFNFMDGANGLAGGMALFGFGFYALAAYLAGATGLALTAACLASAAAGFLLFNFDPARIFMGDAGSIPLGFLAAVLGLAGWMKGCWPLLFPVLVFSPFIVDASVTLARRLLRREKVWHAHREHYYQRLIRMGRSHRKTALAEYALMLACGLAGLSLLGRSGTSQLLAALACLGAYALIMFRIDAAWRHGGNRP
ncbi:MAG: glycosyltransferase family 4 protein [Rhodocyclaceae bacterium]|nr:glycosyltransferase family 4 protein [Rhodocyclaceae bacterium]